MPAQGFAQRRFDCQQRHTLPATRSKCYVTAIPYNQVNPRTFKRLEIAREWLAACSYLVRGAARWPAALQMGHGHLGG
jgi:hypothetical protein